MGNHMVDAKSLLETNAEKRAEAATRHAPFAVNLPDVRRQIQDILTQFGRFGFYNEYTRHDKLTSMKC
jgi:hypothetical protein